MTKFTEEPPFNSPRNSIEASRVHIFHSIAHNEVNLEHQMDVTTTFLNGDLDEEIYIDQPEGY